MPSSRNAIISLLVPNGSSEDTIFESYGTNRFTCAYCEASPMDNKTELLCCSSCARVWYCNELHLLKDWRAHQLFCRTVLSASRSDKPRGTRSILTSTSSVTDDSNFFEEEIPVEPLSHPISRLDKARARANRCINHNKNDDQLVRCDEVKITCAVSATTEKEAEEKKNDDNTVTSTVIDRLVSKVSNQLIDY